MNVYERAKELPKSDLMQYAAAEKESVVDVHDLPENISTQVGAKPDVKLNNDALEQNVELAGQQTEILGKHTDILQSQSKQLAQLNTWPPNKLRLRSAPLRRQPISTV